MAEAMTRGSRASRQQPQTTGEPPGGTFEQHSRKSARPAYVVSGQAYGANITQPLSAAPGYERYLDILIAATGGANATSTTVTYTAGTGADLGGTLATGKTIPTVSGVFGVTGMGSAGVGQSNSPAAAIGFVQVKDAYGTVVFSGNGYEMLHLVPLFSGQVGVLAASDPTKWPHVSTAGLASGTATTSTGNFFLHARIPFEIVPGYGCLAIGNASLQPQLQLQLNGSGAIYSTAPTTAPTLAIAVDENFWAVPVDDPSMEPPGLGTTLQWVQQLANPTIGSAASQRVQFPRVGGYITTIILEARDSTGDRNDNVWPARGGNNRIRLYLDGVPVLDESIEERIDKMYEDSGGLLGAIGTHAGPDGVRPAGVIAYSFKPSLSQANLGQLDNGDTWLSTTPGTLIEVECTPWGSFSSTPANLTVIVGAIVPRGPLQQGLQSLA
jgi:hypothetical protein